MRGWGKRIDARGQRGAGGADPGCWVIRRIKELLDEGEIGKVVFVTFRLLSASILRRTIHGTGLCGKRKPAVVPCLTLDATASKCWSTCLGEWHGHAPGFGRASQVAWDPPLKSQVIGFGFRTVHADWLADQSQRVVISSLAELFFVEYAKFSDVAQALRQVVA